MPASVAPAVFGLVWVIIRLKVVTTTFAKRVDVCTEAREELEDAANAAGLLLTSLNRHLQGCVRCF